MLPNDLDQLSPQDIEALVAARTTECRTLDYKRDLPGRSDSDKKEFLADISSFANASGGFLVFGISERVDADGSKTGEREEIVGIDGTADEEVRRLEEVARTGIAPRISGLQLRCIDRCEEGKSVLVVRIPRSWAGPHMVVFKNASRFFARNSAGKYQLDVHEIRNAFALSQDSENAIHAFRDDRLGRILARETPVTIGPGPMLVVHLIAPQHAIGVASVDVSKSGHDLSLRPLLAGSGWHTSHCYDGQVAFAGGAATSAYSYSLLFRSGAVEGVAPVGSEKKIYPNAEEEILVEALPHYQFHLQRHGLRPPFVFSVALLGVRGCLGPRPMGPREPIPISRDVVVLPEVLVEETAPDAPTILRPMFDALWQTLGFPASGSFDGDRWEPKRVQWYG